MKTGGTLVTIFSIFFSVQGQELHSPMSGPTTWNVPESKTSLLLPRPAAYLLFHRLKLSELNPKAQLTNSTDSAAFVSGGHRFTIYQGFLQVPKPCGWGADMQLFSWMHAFLLISFLFVRKRDAYPQVSGAVDLSHSTFFWTRFKTSFSWAVAFTVMCEFGTWLPPT